MGIISRSDGSIFAWTSGTGIGRFRHDESINGSTGASCYDTDLSCLPLCTILSIYVDQDNHQWFGTPEGVACHTDWETRNGWKVYSDTDGLIH